MKRLAEFLVEGAVSLDILNSHQLGIMVIDPRLNVCAWNETLVRWTGIPTDEALGKNLSELQPEFLNGSFPERIANVFSTGKSLSVTSASGGTFLSVPAPKEYPNQRMAQDTYIRIVSRAPDYAIVTIQDNSTERFQLEELRSEKSRLITTQADLKEANRALEKNIAELEEANLSLHKSIIKSESADQV